MKNISFLIVMLLAQIFDTAVTHCDKYYVLLRNNWLIQDVDAYWTDITTAYNGSINPGCVLNARIDACPKKSISCVDKRNARTIYGKTEIVTEESSSTTTPSSVANITNGSIANVKDGDIANESNEDIVNVTDRDIDNVSNEDIVNVTDRDIDNVTNEDIIDNVTNVDVVTVTDGDIANITDGSNTSVTDGNLSNSTNGSSSTPTGETTASETIASATADTNSVKITNATSNHARRLSDDYVTTPAPNTKNSSARALLKETRDNTQAIIGVFFASLGSAGVIFFVAWKVQGLFKSGSYIL